MLSLFNKKGTCFFDRLSKVCQKVSEWHFAGGSREATTIEKSFGLETILLEPAKRPAHGTLISPKGLIRCSDLAGRLGV